MPRRRGIRRVPAGRQSMLTCPGADAWRRGPDGLTRGTRTRPPPGRSRRPGASPCPQPGSGLTSWTNRSAARPSDPTSSTVLPARASGMWMPLSRRADRSTRGVTISLPRSMEWNHVIRPTSSFNSSSRICPPGWCCGLRYGRPVHHRQASGHGLGIISAEEGRCTTRRCSDGRRNPCLTPALRRGRRPSTPGCRPLSGSRRR